MKQPLILLVEDTPENIDILHGLLVIGMEYRIKFATSGKRALELAQIEAPDLVLLDIMMPEMDGFEVCRRLKADDSLKDVPIIFISALHDTLNKMQAFTCGGVDYITKPFQPDEVAARVRTHLELQQMRTNMKSLVQAKSHELIEANRRLELADIAKNDFLHLISHELRTPANGIIGITDLLFENLPDDPSINKMRSIFNKSRDRMIDTLDDALFLAKVDMSLKQSDLQLIRLDHLLREAAIISDCVVSEIPEISSQVKGELDILTNALSSLIQTVGCFTSDEKQIEIEAHQSNKQTVVQIKGTGPIVDTKALDGFFDVMNDSLIRTSAEPLGLKPIVAEHIILMHGGQVALKANEEGGISLELMFNCASKETTDSTASLN
ncbi:MULTISPECIES: hybrid sensor histidine kinase/response regulator [unclassified Lentimonas]|uniref:hybrid sensor histidine kinase/response regulator n=1 Tax=unclassified Lentimonas TaxID=2630993 RepID=UPI00132A1B19|nr:MULTISPECIES: hybrid sensor histidine kinase/response regulator [unclassified Lentimonas]CAA6677034.1 Unannotated [Lentimonas sp. CC4]CAA6687227.1 Unannotated [Lentimonas sp. CC6]CAA7074372.1 Unannotated [Lentimonas sp. CC4]CAA7171469.1 Unannotated [Lentimonas sp. CC21]CAA7180035.1 Unannotated [Lentimonas sp. CC8]